MHEHGITDICAWGYPFNALRRRVAQSLDFLAVCRCSERLDPKRRQGKLVKQWTPFFSVVLTISFSIFIKQRKKKKKKNSFLVLAMNDDR